MISWFQQIRETFLQGFNWIKNDIFGGKEMIWLYLFLLIFILVPVFGYYHWGFSKYLPLIPFLAVVVLITWAYFDMMYGDEWDLTYNPWYMYLIGGIIFSIMLLVGLVGFALSSILIIPLLLGISISIVAQLPFRCLIRFLSGKERLKAIIVFFGILLFIIGNSLQYLATFIN